MLADPSPHPLKGLLYYWLNATYGHLRMGHRLLSSNCDFLFLDEALPSFWKVVLQAYGSRRGLVPAADQSGATPEVPYSAARRGASRSVNVQSDYSFAAVLMEPVFYNPCMSGWLGARALEPEGFESQHRIKAPAVHLYRGSPQRIADAR